MAVDLKQRSMKILERFVNFARQNSKSEWEQLFLRRRQELRNWIENHPERAAVYGFIGGIVITLFFKAVIALLVVASLLMYVVWHLSKDEQA
jgi:hypothetical protein